MGQAETSILPEPMALKKMPIVQLATLWQKHEQLDLEKRRKFL